MAAAAFRRDRAKPLRFTRSNRNPLDLIECDLITGTVIELGRARAFVRRHGLCLLEGTARFEIGGDTGRPEHVAPELSLEAGLGRAPTDHLVGIAAMHRPVDQHPGSAGCRAEEGGLVEESPAFLLRDNAVV